MLSTLKFYPVILLRYGLVSVVQLLRMATGLGVLSNEIDVLTLLSF